MQLDVFQTLADPTRRRIVEVLRGGERPVNDLVGGLGIHQSGVSRHLRILLAAGFVRVRPDGQRRLYSLRPEPFREIDTWLAGYRELWESRLDRFGEALARKRQARAAGRDTRARAKGEATAQPGRKHKEKKR
ncbi:MAG TPA: metalloregulator ArsR/SmtB family transcription factor [Kofleriaceae bacterium]|nr:metalloregulator ArsR/SmtB family transcription factor [Kofleriaceae bacterium]